MQIKTVAVLICVALCDAAIAVVPKTRNAQDRLESIASLPVTADDAYAQWTDISGGLTPLPATESSSEELKARLLMLERPLQPVTSAAKPVSAHDQALLAQITVFSGSAAADRGIQTARTGKATLEQQWHAELDTLELRRQRERTALPACHNEAGAPSQVAIRDVERHYAEQKAAIAAHYLAQFAPLVAQLKAAVAPRIGHGDSALAAWAQLRNQALRVQLAPLAQGSESAALRDVATVQAYIQDISKLAARPVADRKALERVYAQAKGC